MDHTALLFMRVAGSRGPDSCCIMHRNAGGDGGKNARDMERLGQQIGGERDKQADQDLDGWLLAGAPNQKVITFAGDPHHHEATEDAPEGHQEKFHHRVSRGEAAGQHRGDGEIKGDEP